MVSLPPDSCNIAFKEWAGVCDALIHGRQTVILRKGGISEGAGPGQFAPEHTEVLALSDLVPPVTTRAAAPRGPDGRCPRTAPYPDGSIPIRGFVRLDFFGYVTSEDALPALRPLHCLEDETIRKRFHYRRPGLWVLAARVWRHDPGFSVIPTPDHAGCTTWVILEQRLSTSGPTPVLDDTQWDQECRRIRSILGLRAPVED